MAEKTNPSASGRSCSDKGPRHGAALGPCTEPLRTGSRPTSPPRTLRSPSHPLGRLQRSRRPVRKPVALRTRLCRSSSQSSRPASDRGQGRLVHLGDVLPPSPVWAIRSTSSTIRLHPPGTAQMACDLPEHRPFPLVLSIRSAPRWMCGAISGPAPLRSLAVFGATGQFMSCTHTRSASRIGFERGEANGLSPLTASTVERTFPTECSPQPSSVSLRSRRRTTFNVRHSIRSRPKRAAWRTATPPAYHRQPEPEGLNKMVRTQVLARGALCVQVGGLSAASADGTRPKSDDGRGGEAWKSFRQRRNAMLSRRQREHPRSSGRPVRHSFIRSGAHESESSKRERLRQASRKARANFRTAPRAVPSRRYLKVDGGGGLAVAVSQTTHSAEFVA